MAASRKKKEELPPHSDAARCLRLRKNSKRGGSNSQEDFEFCCRMGKQYPQWYRDTEKEVFNDTVPFGSQSKRD